MLMRVSSFTDAIRLAFCSELGPRVKAMLTLLPGVVFSKGTQEFSFLVFVDRPEVPIVTNQFPLEEIIDKAQQS